MGDSFVTIIAIFLAAILMFVFPLMSISERTDDVSQLSVQTATTEFVDKVRTTGKLTLDDYDKYVQTITSTGNSFEVSMQAQILDENPGVKTTQAETTKIPIAEAFDELDSERDYYQERRKESNARLIQKKGMIGKVIGFAPMVGLFVGYLIVPLVFIGLMSMMSSMNDMSSMAA